tara:strand:+ start:4676 stop:5395 length:720 start_codon:yes stop_codon:yes gene_type:complete
MEIMVSLSAKITKSLRGTIKMVAKRAIKFEDDDHESNIKRGETFYLKKLGNKHYLIDVEGKDLYQFALTEKEFLAFKKAHTEAKTTKSAPTKTNTKKSKPTPRKKPDWESKRKRDSESLTAEIDDLLAEEDDPQERISHISVFLSLRDDDLFQLGERASELKYKRKTKRARLSKLKRAKRQTESNANEQRYIQTQLDDIASDFEWINDALAKAKAMRKAGQKLLEKENAKLRRASWNRV